MASTTLNPTTTNETKNSRRKKGKSSESTNPSSQAEAEASPAPDARVPHGGDGTNGAESSGDNPYLKELHKTIRNLKKKLTATQKIDAIQAENPGKSLDELLASRKINADQKAQIEKKPAVKANIEQLEEQLEHYKKFDDDYQKKLAAQKQSLEASHQEELERVKESAISDAKTNSKNDLREKLLGLSRFLRAAAAKRQDGDDTAEENRAFEGALLLVYGGDESAVQAMENLIDGSEELVPTVEGVPSSYSYKRIRDVSAESASYAAEEAWVNDVAQADAAAPGPESTSIPAATDPTVLHAGLTELDAQSTIKTNGDNSNGFEHQPPVPEAGIIDSGAANAAAEANWDADAKLSASATSGPDGWVEVPRDPAETETGFTATPAAVSGNQSWAEDIPTETTAVPQSAPSDGFREVQHSRGRGRGNFQGEHRGEHHRGHRGRGNRGDRGEGYRGRGGYRGEHRGEGHHRGDRNNTEGGGYRGRGRGGGPRGGQQRGRGDSS